MDEAEGDWRSVAQNLTELLLNSVGSGEGRGRGRPGRKTTQQGRRSNNGRALSQAECSSLAWSIIWVALHVRDAVLVDQVCLSKVQQRKVWKTLSNWQDLSSRPEDTLFHDVCFLRHRPTGQLFIINRGHTSSRASALLQSEERDAVPPLLIAVDEAVRPGTNLDEVPPVLRVILEQLSTIHAASEHGSTPAILELSTPSYAAVGLAGWLLGYPSIYLFVNRDGLAKDGDIVIDLRVIHEEEDIAENAVEDEESWEEPLRNNLGGTQLCLFQASLVLPSSASSADRHIPLFAFTVPLTALQQPSTADSFKTTIVDDLNRRKLNAMERLKRSIEAPSNSAAQESSPFLTTCRRINHMLSHCVAHVDVSQVELPLVAL